MLNHGLLQSASIGGCDHAHNGTQLQFSCLAAQRPTSSRVPLFIMVQTCASEAGDKLFETWRQRPSLYEIDVKIFSNRPDRSMAMQRLVTELGASGKFEKEKCFGQHSPTWSWYIITMRESTVWAIEYSIRVRSTGRDEILERGF